MAELPKIGVYGNTDIILDRIILTAVIGGNEVINPFMITEVYVQVDNK